MNIYQKTSDFNIYIKKSASDWSASTRLSKKSKWPILPRRFNANLAELDT